jgi:hypothetical protein
MKEFVINLRTNNSVFINQTSTGAFVALPSQACTACIFSVQPSSVAGVPNGIQVRKGGSGGWVYVREGESHEVAVYANASELQIMAAQGLPIVGVACRIYNGDLVYPAIG